MSDIEELKARLLVIHDHDGNDLSPNDKRGLKDACAELDKLKRYEEREPLVMALLAKCDGICNSDVDAKVAVVAVLYARDDVRDFKLE